MRMLDDVYGDDRDSFPLEQEARWRISRLEWEDDLSTQNEKVWYRVPDEDEEVWCLAPNKQTAPKLARRPFQPLQAGEFGLGG